jgi:FAD:protein FMN transferase
MDKFLLRSLLFLVIICNGSFTHTDIRRIHIAGRAQGTTYSIIYYADDSIVKKKSIDSIVLQLDASLSIYQPGSLINTFNSSTSGGMVDHHLYKVVSEALKIYTNTNGAFDITVMPLTQAWGFGTAKRDKPPTDEEIKTILPCVGSDHLTLTNDSLLKNLPCTRIDVNGIAQGYSVDCIAAFLETCGIMNYIVELGGEIRARGKKPGNKQMKIGIESPEAVHAEAGIFSQIIGLDSGAITTSGNYRKFYESGGRIISHLLDPATGYSINNELIAVTVYANKAIVADGYDNALMNMGLKKALRFVDERSDLAAYFIYRDSSGLVRDSATKAFPRLLQTSPAWYEN